MFLYPLFLYNKKIMQTKYDHKLVEKDKNKKWIDKKFFSNHDFSKKPFSIILPPPNVTGKLHLGHAWDGYIQDTIIRYKKLSGYDVFFIPGMDHAGIATQVKVEEKLLSIGINKNELGREKFIEQTYVWKEEYSKHIHDQWSKLGLALDYQNENFTLDKNSNDAVNKAFINLYNEGLIYRDVKPINWDPKLQTAISNIEIISKPTNSKMYYVRYYFEENKNEYIVIATTRIETIFSDVAIAFNPNDQTKQKLLNKKVINPLTNQAIPIICDDYIDPEFGTGFMKVSAHALNDIEIIKKNNLEIKECINKQGLMNENGLFTKGLNRNQARVEVFNFLDKNSFIEKVEDITNNVSYSERSDEVIEILIMPQWFVKMDSLSKRVLENLNSKDKLRIIPTRFQNVLEKWLLDIHDWTISRQLWWGHQIPAWYKDDQIKVQIESPGIGWKRDEDVLDTWFSSGLAPLSFLGWPNDTNKIDRYFPTSLLVTGYDIIFFWVARMYFFSIFFKNKKPFEELLIHGLIRDEKGRKMSKSLGNGIDPMELIENYGSDSLRWYLLTNSTPGQDINFSIDKLNISWNLCNKLWNISRYIKNIDSSKNDINNFDIWIVNKLLELKTNIEQKMINYEFTIIGKEINNFIYNTFSSWYIEFSKVNINKEISLLVLKNLLILIHPFLPFLTDHLFKEIFNEELLENSFNLEKIGEENTIDIVIDSVSLIRDARNAYSISNKEKIFYELKNISDSKIISLINKLANADFQKNDGALFTKNNISINIIIPEEVRHKEKIKTEELLKKIEFEIERSTKILSNKKFLENANSQKILEEKNKFENYKKQYAELKEKMENF